MHEKNLKKIKTFNLERREYKIQGRHFLNSQLDFGNSYDFIHKINKPVSNFFRTLFF